MGARTMMGETKITAKGAVPGAMRKSDWNREILKPSLEAQAEAFFKKNLPVRFTRRGAKMLNYAPRKGEETGLSEKEFRKSYTGRKLRRKGHTIPLRWSDVSMNLARIKDIRTTSKRARVVIHARGLNRRNPNSKINMRDEVTRMAPEEVKPLVRVYDVAMQSNLDAYNKTKTVRI